ncbi:FMN-binding protein [Fusobacterium russii]|uniref:FMN-binding protein n=1 Tax=Fusobacterium russii TaxID=854 RepID=UPI0003A29AC1|nr:FMN-binding protein [Fusobacterium russii]
MKKYFNLIGVFLLVLVLNACGSGKNFSKMSFNDGIYQGKAENDDPKSSVEIIIEIKDNKIVASSSEFRDAKGNIKDENYGKEAGEAKYLLAQKSVAGMNQYAAILLDVQDPEKVDAISGATISNKLFKEAVWNALETAKK